MADKQDSNLTGLRFAEEASLRTLPGSPVWYPLEPNSYTDFGGQLETVARNPINPSRQRKKGTIVDLDASGGFNQDLTMSNLTRLLQGFFFADARQKADTLALNVAAVTVASVTAADDKYNTSASPGSTYIAGSLAYASGFGVAANNGLKVAVSADANDLTVAASPGLTNEASPPAAARLQHVGHRFGSATSAIALNGNLVQLTDSAQDMTLLGLLAGEWVYLGSDTGTCRFANNVGFARVSEIATGYIEFDKVSWTPATEAGTGLTIELYFGTVLRNEPDKADIVRRTYQVERTLGDDGVGEMSELLVGAVANELTLNVPQGDKVTVDLSFIAMDNEQRSGTDGLKSGTRPDITAEDAINTSSDFARIALASVDATDATVSPLFAYADELTLTINNNVSPTKAIGVLGGFDTVAGSFIVGGSLEVYFADIEAVQAVRNNADVTLDFIMVKSNKGIVFDIPLLGLGDGRLAVEPDTAIKLPLENNAAESAFGYTLLMMTFPYLPTLAG